MVIQKCVFSLHMFVFFIVFFFFFFCSWYLILPALWSEKMLEWFQFFKKLTKVRFVAQDGIYLSILYGECSMSTGEKGEISCFYDSLQPHESQHARPPCPSPTLGVHSDPRPSSQWCHPAISSSVVLFSSCPQSLPASVFSHESTLLVFLSLTYLTFYENFSGHPCCCKCHFFCFMAEKYSIV